MKFFQTTLALLLYCIAWVHVISCVIRIGLVKKPPVFPGQIWSLPGAGNVLIVNVTERFVYYESIADHDKTWYCRIGTFKEFAQITSEVPSPAPVEHLISKQESNVIHLKKDEKNDRV